jgi:arsenate reductase
MNILFMCVANSARSQLAEGLAKAMFGNQASFYSAGSTPSKVNPLAIKVLKEISVDITGHSSKSVEDISQKDFDYVITLCAEEVCPLFLGKAKKLHWPFQDPAGETNPDLAEINFRRIRDLIKARLDQEIPKLLKFT